MVLNMITWYKFVILLWSCTELSVCQYQGLSGHQLWKLDGSASHVTDKLLKSGLADVFDHRGPTTQIRVNPKNAEEVREVLRQEGITHTVLVEDLAIFLEEKEGRSLKKQTESCTSASCPQPLLDSYMTFEEIEWYLSELKSTYASKVEVTSIGKSIEGRDIWQVLIKSSGCTQGNAVWLEGGIHAREWISPAVSLNLIDKLAKECSPGKLLDVYVVPVSNPDGYAYSWTNDRLWRKNRRDIPDTDCDGVDLNRNWDYDYGIGASESFCNEVYMGTSPFSEPETTALKTAMEKVNQEKNLLMVIAIHSFGQDLLYPWGGKTVTAPDTPAMIELGNNFADAAKKSSGTKYTVVNSGTGYGIVSGATDDWSKGVLGVKYAYTLELRDTGREAFILGTEQIRPTVQEVWDGMKAMFLSISPQNCSLL